MLALFPKLFIFSAYQNDKTKEENETNHMQVFSHLKRYGFEPKEIDGFYKGTPEKSILLFDQQGLFERIVTLAKLYNQEAILVSEAFRESYLYYPKTNTSDYVGKLQEISNPNNYDAYSKIDNKYYTCVIKQ